jgi:hypothetical protein
MKSILISSATLAAGALLLSGAALSQAIPPDQPQAKHQQTRSQQTGDQQTGKSGGQPAFGGQERGQGQAAKRPQGQAEAQPMVPVADVSLTFSATASEPAKAIAVAPDVDVIPVTLYMTTTNSGDGKFMHAMSGICSGSAFLHNSDKTVEAAGFCNYGDEDGDVVFEHFVIPPQPQGDPLKAAGHWTGGTGKYLNLDGGFVLTGLVLPALPDGIIRLAGQKQGRYTMEAGNQTEAPPQGQAPSSENQSQSGPGQAR